MWEWLGREENQRTLRLIGAGTAAIIAGCWALFLWYSALPAHTKTYMVCKGEDEAKCATHDLFVGCGDPIRQMEFKCGALRGNKVFESGSGGACGYELWTFTCE